MKYWLPCITMSQQQAHLILLPAICWESKHPQGSGKTTYTIIHHPGSLLWLQGFLQKDVLGLIQQHFVHKKTTCTIHVPSKWLEYLFPATASSKTSCFCESEVLQPRNMNNILPTQINPQPSMNTLGSHPSRDGVTVYQVLKAKTPVATNKFTWQMQLACRYRNVYAPEKQRGSPKNHPIEFRKIIWSIHLHFEVEKNVTVIFQWCIPSKHPKTCPPFDGLLPPASH